MNENDSPQPGGPTGPTGQGPHEGPRVSTDEMRDLGRLRRPANRTVAGVSAALARHFDVDPVLFRIAFVVLTFFGGAGLVLYGALWLLVPEETTDRAVMHLDERSRGLGLVGAGVLAVVLVLGDSWGGFWFPWPLALLALGIWYFFFRDRGPRSGGPAPYGTLGAAPYGAPGTTPYDAPGAAPYGAPATPPTGATDPTGWSGQGQVPGQGQGQPAYAGAGQTAQQTYPGYQWAPPPPPPPRPRDPRRRGPLLFPFTAALTIFALGCLGLAQVAGLDIPFSAYPALALGITAVMLVVGAFWGRAGGLIALGLVAALVTGIGTAAESHESEVVTMTPVSAAAVDEEYWLNSGEVVLDLTEVEDLSMLDGRTLRVGAGVGRIEVVVPRDVDATVRARLGGFGGVTLFGAERGGVGTEWTRTHDGGPDSQADIELDVELAIGEIVVRSE